MTLKEVLFFRAAAEFEWFEESKKRSLQGWHSQKAWDTMQAEERWLSVYQVIEEAELKEEFWQWMQGKDK